ncbi:chymotrypsin-C-like [Wyeomyia smithii]|uniref:chymotrypsin-C-like n=1 Tax=Wyeomyia smithii TaxID=174621 RepID=UPI002467D11C|nr:chymotrypsin-C-like [Wyeomyia smithii]
MLSTRVVYHARAPSSEGFLMRPLQINNGIKSGLAHDDEDDAVAEKKATLRLRASFVPGFANGLVAIGWTTEEGVTYACGGTLTTARFGDSGGPIQTERLDVHGTLIPLIVGVVSFGTPCAKGSVGVYTRVASYRRWLENETKQTFGYMDCLRKSMCINREQVPIGISSPSFYPVHRVSIRWFEKIYFQYHCGATLIDYRFAITSASCVSKKPSPGYIESSLSDEKVPIQDLHVHPAYSNGGEPQNDIALVKLAMYLIAKENILPACLWRESEINGEHNQIYFSAYNKEFELYDSARENSQGQINIEADITNNGRCIDPLQQRQNLLCASNNISLIPSVCKLNYGEPIAILMNNPHITCYITGVISSLSAGCNDDLIGTRIYPHIDWIESVVLDRPYEGILFPP